MADWAHALSQGLAAGAQAGADIIDTRMKNDLAMQAEQRAADLKLDTASRMLAIEDAMKTRAAERFSIVVKGKMGEQVPAAAAPLSETGITHESGVAAGLKTGGLQASPAEMKRLATLAQRTMDSPGATDAQREDARALMEQIANQAGAQEGINANAAAGKTRNRTIDEAQQAALDDTLQNDAGAFMAGTGMLAADDKKEMGRMQLQNKADMAKLRDESYKDRTDSIERARAQTDATRLAIEQARREAAEEKARNGGVSASVKTMLIHSEDANIKSSNSEMSMLSRQLGDLGPRDADRKKQINDRIAELRQDIQDSKDRKSAYMEDMGILKPKAKDGGPVKPTSAQSNAADPLGLFAGKKK